MKTFLILPVTLVTIGLLFPVTAVTNDISASSSCNTKCQIGQLQAPILAGNFSMVNFGGTTCLNTIIVSYANYGTLPALSSNMTITVSWTTTICGSPNRVTLGPFNLGNVPGRTINMLDTGPQPIPPADMVNVNVTFHWSK